jgi:hypothetical protein
LTGWNEGEGDGEAKSECIRMDEPITAEKTLSPFILRRLGWALRERITLYPTVPSRLYDLVMRLDCSECPPQRPDERQGNQLAPFR